MIIILMGVSGSGKSRIGQMLSEKLNIPFLDGDDVHPVSNIEKMAAGNPLNDLDRLPWLEELARRAALMEETGGGILACSALKKAYRRILEEKSGIGMVWIHLKGDRKLIADRLRQRSGHYMPETLLDSQFKALEEPENARLVKIDRHPGAIVDEIVHFISELGRNPAGPLP
jgi:carbohydrate kinase (thermoresistant glucokinase family)